MTRILIFVGIAAVVIVGAMYLKPSRKSAETVPVGETSNINKPITMSNGLEITDVTVGTGAVAESGKQVTVHYVGTLENGTKFDSSRDRKMPFTFQLGAGAVIAGWDQGVAGMRVGGVRKLVIPASLGYGSRANGPIPANSVLIFEVELLDVK